MNVSRFDQLYYPTTRVKISGEKGCWEMCNLPTLILIPIGHGIKSAIPCPLRNCTIPNEATIGPQEPQEWFLEAQQLPS